MAACLGLGLGELHQWRVRRGVVGLQKEGRQINADHARAGRIMTYLGRPFTLRVRRQS